MPSPSYILTRLLQIIPTFLFIMVVTFVLVRLLPGDPTSAILGDRATDADVARINAQLGLDRPIPVQFLYFLERFAHGDLGISINLHMPVVQLIAQRLPVTLVLTAYAALLSILLAVPLAFIAALRVDRPADVVIRSAFQVGLSTPVFYLGPRAAHDLRGQSPLVSGGRLWRQLGAAALQPFPAGAHPGAQPVGRADAQPACLDHRGAAGRVCGLRARSKGLAPRIVLLRHVLRNALISTVTLFGLNIGTLLGGAVITETVFAIPGAGRLMIESIYGRDYPVVQGLTLALAILVSLVFLLTDLVQAALDPRVKR